MQSPFFIAIVYQRCYIFFNRGDLRGFMKNKRVFIKIFVIVATALAALAAAAWVGFEYYLSLPCPAERPLRDAQTRFCHACASDEKIQLDPASKLGFKEQCAVCPEREVDRYLGFYCILKCPSDKPLRDFNDVCHACDGAARIYVGYSYEAACGVCSGREFNHGFCFKKCPSEKPFRDALGTCRAKEEL